MEKRFGIKGENFMLQSDEISKDLDFEILSRSSKVWVVRHNHKIYHCDILDFDAITKFYKLDIDGKTIAFHLQDEVDMLVEDMGMNEVAAVRMDRLLAPMPGLVLSVDVEIGQEVQEGDSLLILEAMKMENVIKAAGTGVVKEIKVGQGDKVDKDQLLLLFE